MPTDLNIDLVVSSNRNSTRRHIG